MTASDLRIRSRRNDDLQRANLLARLDNQIDEAEYLRRREELGEDELATLAKMNEIDPRYGIVLDGAVICVTQSRHEAQKTAKEIGGKTKKVAAPEAVVTGKRM